MATIDENLIRLNNVKTSWRQALASKGQEVSADAPMESYVVATGGIEPVLQDKSIEITENGTTTVSADTGYDGLNEVEITTNVAGADGAIAKLNTSLSYSNSSKTPDRFGEIIEEVKIDANDCPDMNYMFYQLKNLKKVDILNSEKLTVADFMFNFCESITQISTIDVSNITNMSSMFSNCTNLTEINITETSSVTDIRNCFRTCTKLTKINGIINLYKCFNASGIFGSSGYAATRLKEVRIKDVRYSLDIQYATALSHNSLIYLIENLVDRTSATSSPKLTLGSTNLAKLTEEEKAIATAKNWTLA